VDHWVRFSYNRYLYCSLTSCYFVDDE